MWRRQRLHVLLLFFLSHRNPGGRFICFSLLIYSPPVLLLMCLIAWIQLTACINLLGEMRVDNSLWDDASDSTGLIPVEKIMPVKLKWCPHGDWWVTHSCIYLEKWFDTLSLGRWDVLFYPPISFHFPPSLGFYCFSASLQRVRSL